MYVTVKPGRSFIVAKLISARADLPPVSAAAKVKLSLQDPRLQRQTQIYMCKSEICRRQIFAPATLELLQEPPMIEACDSSRVITDGALSVNVDLALAHRQTTAWKHRFLMSHITKCFTNVEFNDGSPLKFHGFYRQTVITLKGCTLEL